MCLINFEECPEYMLSDDKVNLAGHIPLMTHFFVCKFSLYLEEISSRVSLTWRG